MPYLAAMIAQTLKENKKVVFFLLRFLSVFGGFSLLYAVWIKSYGLEADPFSWFVGYNLQGLLGSENLRLYPIEGYAAIGLDYLGSNSVSLFEGCNGIAVFILFFAFVFAFKGRWSDLIWFVPLGIVVIHLFNLARLVALIMLAEQGHDALFHFMHKYLFSLVIYAGVFLMWVFWVRLALKRNKQKANENPA